MWLHGYGAMQLHEVGGGVLQISSERDDRRVFGGLKFQLWFFLGRKILASIFLGSLI